MSTIEKIKKRLEQDWVIFLKKNSKKIYSNVIAGASPPSLFVGHKGYPRVNVGPLVPPIHGNTGILDCPEAWTGRTINQIVNFRMNLIRGIVRSNAKKPSGKYIDTLQEMAMSVLPVESTVTFNKNPFSANIFSSSDAVLTPSMLSAGVTEFRPYQIRADLRIQNVYYDNDLRSSDAMIDLYYKGLSINQIAKILSIGMMGRKKSRKLVPTRWSITATDQTISSKLMEFIRHYQIIDSLQLFAYSHLENRYWVLLIPNPVWSFEMVEAWRDTSSGIVVGSDFEDSRGLTHYPSIEGAYFAGRLAVAEYLHSSKRLAAVLILREILPEYIFPVGVWQIREGVRMALKSKPTIFRDLHSSLIFVANGSSVPMSEWLRNSRTFREQKVQSRISDFFQVHH
jgi:DNA repair protein NreA